MRLKQMQLAKMLAFSGLIPFVAGALAHVSDYAAGSLQPMVLTYATVIISFLCGMHWGIFLSQAAATRLNLLLTSNLIVLLVWVSHLMFTPAWQILVQISCFSLLLLVDRKLAAEGVIERWFYQLRKQVSLLVLVCLLILLVYPA